MNYLAMIYELPDAYIVKLPPALPDLLNGGLDKGK
jgi:hypothetical protein